MVGKFNIKYCLVSLRNPFATPNINPVVVGRHGEGYHNVAESYYGTPAWNVSRPFLDSYHKTNHIVLLVPKRRERYRNLGRRPSHPCRHSTSRKSQHILETLPRRGEDPGPRILLLQPTLPLRRHSQHHIRRPPAP